MANPSGILSGPTQGLFGGPNANLGAPTIDTSGAAGWQGDPTKSGGNQEMQQTAEELALAQANGTGPSAATTAAITQEKKAQAGMGALAASGAGSSGNALAKRQAMIQGGAAESELGGQAATARAAEQIAGGQQLGAVTGQARGQDLNASNINAGIATNQAQIGEQQNQVNAASAEANAGANQQMLGSLAGMAAGAAMFADADVGQTDFVEPKGKAAPGDEAHWTLREEKGFILARNQRTGQNFKLQTVPLTPEEQRQAQAPHGAGPLGANDPKRKHSQMNDGEMGAPPQGGMVKEQAGPQNFAEVVRRAHPKLYKAAMADGDMDAQWGSAGGGERAPTPSAGKQQPATPPPSHAPIHLGANPYSNDSAFKSASEHGTTHADGEVGGTGYSSDWAKADSLAGAASGQMGASDAQAGSDYGNTGWDDPIRARGGAAPGDPETEDTTKEQVAASGQNPDGSHGFQNAIGGALMGFSNPNALGKLAFQKMGARQVPGGTKQPASTTVSDGDFVAEPQDTSEEVKRGIASLSRPGEVDEPTKSGRSVFEEASHRAKRDTGYQFPVSASPAGHPLWIVGGNENEGTVSEQDPNAPDAEDKGGKTGRGVVRGMKELAPAVDAPKGLYPAIPYGAPGDWTERGEYRPQYENEDIVGGSRQSSAEYMDGDMRTGERGSRDNPVDLDDPLEVWSAEKQLQAPREARRMASEMEAMNPYETKVRTSLDQPKPMVRLFAAKAKAPKVGPTDWMAAMRKDANLPGALQDWQKDEAETAAREALVGKKLNLDLVPGEMETVTLPEAQKRTKNRSAVRALMAEWEAEKRTPQHGDEPESAYAMNDGDLRAAAGSALSKLGIKRKKVA